MNDEYHKLHCDTCTNDFYSPKECPMCFFKKHADKYPSVKFKNKSSFFEKSDLKLSAWWFLLYINIVIIWGFTFGWDGIFNFCWGTAIAPWIMMIAHFFNDKF